MSILILVSQETCVVCRLFDQLSIREKTLSNEGFFLFCGQEFEDHFDAMRSLVL
nr:MAG TPA: hypothetical protein [Caudoviricetes sp.]DAP28917.1 MAG TPA: hypothetical protein [Caudoviricetes sp.]